MHARKQQRVIRLAAVCGLLAAVIAGCGGPSRAVVTGTVTYQGKAISKGAISFLPCEGTVAAATIAEIVDGKYKVDSLGGLPVGVYQAQIVAYRPYSGAGRNVIIDPLNSGIRDLEQYIPKQYNVKTELKVTVEPSRRPLTRDFTLTD
jgi:hypothetical protein